MELERICREGTAPAIMSEIVEYARLHGIPRHAYPVTIGHERSRYYGMPDNLLALATLTEWGQLEPATRPHRERLNIGWILPAISA